MRPSDFKLNSDYLSIAQIDAKTYTVTVGAGTLQPGQYLVQNFNFTIPSRQGAIDRILIKKDSSDYIAGSFAHFYIGVGNPIHGYLSVFHSSKTNLRAELALWNTDTSNPHSYPNMSFKIKVASFHPPNVF